MASSTKKPLFNLFSFQLIFFFILILMLDYTFAQQIVEAKEAMALLTWKASLDNQSRFLLSSWRKWNETTPCQWLGITCDDSGALTSLNLSSFGLKGTLQSLSFSSFPSLNILDLYNNSFYGPIPPPIANLSQLTYLRLSINQFSGSIPHEIGLLTSTLSILYLSRNQFFGSIPQEIGELTSLTELSLFGNNLTGSIPASIGNLGNLTVLHLYRNGLFGPIPPTIGNLNKLTTLCLEQNQLSGSIPPQVGKLNSLVLLRLFENRLTGSIPQEISNLTNLNTLHLGDNMLSGYVPENLCSTGLLENFTAYNNYLVGSVPTSLTNCTSLFRVRLEGNQLTGDISEAFGIHPYLNYIDLSFNNFHGELSHKWRQSRSLASLKISNNRISGRIPGELGETTQLGELDLSGNELVGEIPNELGNLVSLFVLNLENNKLLGSIPLETGRLPKLVELNLAANMLTGSIPQFLSARPNLLHLNLSRNRLSGAIPFSIGNLRSLQTLDLSQNLLLGEINQQLGELRMMETLNLSRNNLSGSIPPTFINLISLTIVDLSYNQLQGQLPNNRAFREAPFESFRNNKALCGNATGLKACHSTTTNNNKRTRIKVIIIVVPTFGALFLLALSIGIYLGIKWIKRRNMLIKVSHFEPLSTIWRCIKRGEDVGKIIFDATEGFSSKHCIGKGGHGTVYKAKLQNVLVVAVKKVHEAVEEDGYYKAYENEIRTLREIQHRNIVKLYGFGRHEKHIFLVYKFMERGSLRKMLSNEEEAKELDWAKRVNIVKGVANALSYMHHDCYPPLIHRDISSSNVLLDSEYEAHVSDFGTSTRLIDYDDSFSNWTSFAGTVGYAAPELAHSRNANEKCDVYSFGVVAMVVIMGRHPGDLVGSRSLILGHHTPLNDMLDQRLPLPFDGDLAAEVVSVLNLAFMCLLPTPQSRPTMRQIKWELSAQR